MCLQLDCPSNAKQLAACGTPEEWTYNSVLTLEHECGEMK